MSNPKCVPVYYFVVRWKWMGRTGDWWFRATSSAEALAQFDRLHPDWPETSRWVIEARSTNC